MYFAIQYENIKIVLMEFYNHKTKMKMHKN